MAVGESRARVSKAERNAFCRMRDLDREALGEGPWGGMGVRIMGRPLSARHGLQ